MGTQLTSIKVVTAEELLNEEFPKRELLLSPWLKERMSVLAHAPTGIGKSWWVWSLAVAVASGCSFGPWKSNKPSKVLIIDGEMAPDDLQERLEQLIQHMSAGRQLVEKNLVISARQHQPPRTNFIDIASAEHRNYILDKVDEHNPDLVIFDNLSTLAHVEDENAASSFDGVIELLNEIKQKRSVILVHHDRKGKTTHADEGYRGSGKIAAVFEQRVHLNKVDASIKPLHGGACFNIKFEKNRYLGDGLEKSLIFELDPSRGWVIGEDEDEFQYRLVEAVKSAKFASQKELAAHFEVSEGWVSKTLQKADIQGDFANSGHYKDILRDVHQMRTAQEKLEKRGCKGATVNTNLEEMYADHISTAESFGGGDRNLN